MKTLAVFLFLALALTAAAFCPRIKQKTLATISLAPLVTATNADVTLHRLHAAVPARLWEVYVHEGTSVTRGQVLAKLAVPLNSLERQRAQAEVEKATREHAALLATPGGDAAALEQGRQRVARANQQLSNTPRQMTFVFVQASASGTIVSLPVLTGSHVSDTTAIAVLAEPNQVPTTALTAN
jgi:multidrug resistance efflux pump